LIDGSVTGYNWRWEVNSLLGLLYLSSSANKLGGHDLALGEITEDISIFRDEVQVSIIRFYMATIGGDLPLFWNLLKGLQQFEAGSSV
jgi:hypothetical protein